MVRNNKQTKEEQASMQSDQLEMGFTQGITHGGDLDSQFSYSFGDLGDLHFPEEEMREKGIQNRCSFRHQLETSAVDGSSHRYDCFNTGTSSRWLSFVWLQSSHRRYTVCQAAEKKKSRRGAKL